MGSILLAILLLAILIVVHELGHFWAARLMKIEVMEFGVGFGPKLFGWTSRKHETRFAIRAIPLGGYNAFYGEDGRDEVDEEGERKPYDPADPRNFANQNVWRRMFVILMGPMMNFLLAFLLATGYYWTCGIPTATGVDPYLSSVAGAGPAYDAGLQPGDVITEINGKDMLDGSVDTLLTALGGYREGEPPLQMTVRRGEETLRVDITPQWNETEGRMMVGVTIGGRLRVASQPATLMDAARASGEMCWQSAGMILNALKKLVTTGEGFNETSGPIGIISIVSTEVRAGGFMAFLELLITISINLGLMNLLPIPGLDGSKLILGLVEVIRGKPVSPRTERTIGMVGMVILLALMLVMTTKDVLQLFR